ncbi:hypothetical protein E1H18_3270 [Caulobacter sp. RHG1]|nr:hypothetical protein [Caulobacter sp. RHG1]
MVWFPASRGPWGRTPTKERGYVMNRTLNAFESAFDRMAGVYFIVMALAVAGGIIGVVI